MFLRQRKVSLFQMDLPAVRRYNIEKPRKDGDFVKTRNELLKEIILNLEYFAREVELHLNQGRTDILIDAEAIFRDLLNMMYNLDLKLDNHPGVDLIDDTNAIAVQLTTSLTSAKIKKTISVVGIYELYRRFDQIWVLGLTTKGISKRLREIHPSRFDLKIMNLPTLFEDLNSLPVEILSQISSHLDNTIGAAKQRSDSPIHTVRPILPGEALSPTQRQVLALASLLPPEGLDARVFTHGLLPAQRRVLPELLERGFMFTDGAALCLHPDIRAEFQSELQASNLDITYFLNQVWHYEQCWHWERATLQEQKDARHSLAQIFASAALLMDGSIHIYAQRSAELWMSVQQYQSALEEGRIGLSRYAYAGTTDLGYAQAWDFIGDCYSGLGQHHDALAAWQHTLDFCEQSPNISKGDLAAAIHKVGCAHLALDHINSAHTHLTRELTIREDLLNSCQHVPAQPGLKEMYTELSTVFTKLGSHQQGLQASANALRSPDERNDFWGRVMVLEDLSDTAICSDLNTIFSNIEDPDERYWLEQSFLELRDKELPPGDPALSGFFYRVGVACTNMGDYIHALEYHRRSLEILERILGADPRDLASTYDNIGSVYFDLGDYPKSLYYHSLGLSLRDPILPLQHPERATSYFNMGAVYEMMGDSQKAQEFFQKGRNAQR